MTAKGGQHETYYRAITIYAGIIKEKEKNRN